MDEYEREMGYWVILGAVAIIIGVVGIMVYPPLARGFGAILFGGIATEMISLTGIDHFRKTA